MEEINLDNQIEAVLFWKGEPMSIKKLAASLGKKEEEIKTSLEILKEKIIKEKEKGKLIFITSHLLSELDDLITEIIFMQEGEVHFHKKVDDLKAETNETKISKAIASILKQKQPETQNPKLETAS